MFGENEKGEWRGICGEGCGKMTLELGGNYGCAIGGLMCVSHYFVVWWVACLFLTFLKLEFLIYELLVIWHLRVLCIRCESMLYD